MEMVSEEGTVDSSCKKPIVELWKGFTYFENGDTIVAKITPCFENGKGALIEEMGSKIGFGSTEFHVLRPSVLIQPKFLFYLTKTHIFRKMGETMMYGAAGQKRVPASFLEEYVLGLPPMEEQIQIVRYLDDVLARIKYIAVKAQKEIDLFQEYRLSLISEIVTGKIDIRES
jgi:restriction endonuclease S subunit